MKIEIEVPNPPDGQEIFSNPAMEVKECEGHFVHGRWVRLTSGQSSAVILARKKRTLADWANEQELFKALAKMAGNSSPTVDPGRASRHGWYLRGTPGEAIVWVVHLGEIPSELPNAMLKLTNGKWELA